MLGPGATIVAIPKQGSRRIEVDGETYLWRVRRRPTASQRSARTPMLVTIATESGGAALIVRPHFFHPSNQVALCSQAVTPGQVADYVREARRAGWAPTNPGRPFELRPSAKGRNALRTWPRGLRPRSPSELATLALTRPPEGRDTFRLVPDPVSESWPERGGVWSALIEINGVSLIELARVAERPHVEREYAERAARGDAPDWNADDLAGNYFGMPYTWSS